ncbi:hypothetical protein H4S08_004938 [Coemansia sp. RSA 1365]|nr:hypothetical protein H4S08_004938 [Coemansia sp. RSA 1365]
MDRQREEEEESDDSEDDRRPRHPDERGYHDRSDGRRRRDVRFDDERPRRHDDSPDEHRSRHREQRSTLRRHPPNAAVIDLASLQATPSANAQPPIPGASANPANYPMPGYMQYPGMYGGMYPGQMPMVGPTQSNKHSRRQASNNTGPGLVPPQLAHMPGYPMPYYHPGMWMGGQQNMPPMPAGYNQNAPPNMPVAASMPVSPRAGNPHRETQQRASADDNRRILHDSIQQDASDARPDSFFPPELANTFRSTANNPDDLPPSYQSVEAQQLRNAAR